MMGEALIETMRECLKDSFTPATEEAWQEVYLALSGAMIEAMNDDITVLNSWNQIKEIENYEEHAGVILFRR
jgi:hemoglobin-like flavoprotein